MDGKWGNSKLSTDLYLKKNKSVSKVSKMRKKQSSVSFEEEKQEGMFSKLKKKIVGENSVD